MKVLRSVSLWLCAVAICVSAGFAGENETVFTLRDHLGRTWRNELVTFRFETSGEPCHLESITLVGPDGPLPVQLANIVYGPDRASVRSADVSFIVPQLDALQSTDYVVRYGPGPAKPPAPAAKLDILQKADTVWIDTGVFATELAVGGQQGNEPVPPATVPGPLGAMRLANGTRFGGSRLYGETPIRRWRGELTAAGPVFAQVSYRYEYAGGVELVLVARIAAGDTAILWDMETTGGSLPEDGVRFLLSPGLPPLTFVFQGEFYSKRGALVGREVEPGDLLALPLREYPDALITRLTPWNDWWDDTTQTAIVLRVGEQDNTALAIVAREPGDWVEPAPPGTWVSHGTVYRKMLPLEKLPDGEIVLHANSIEGVRAWTFNVDTAARDDGQKPPDDAALLELAPQTRVGRELDRIRRWVLHWPGDEGTHPRVYVSRDDLAAHWAQAEPDAEELQELIRQSAGPPSRVHWRADMLAMNAWLMTGSADVAEQVHLVERLRYPLNLLGDYDRMRNASRVAVMYDLLIDSDLIAPEQRAVLQAQLAYLGYVLASPENWSMERGYCSGNLNMSVAHILNLGVLAATIPEHPMAQQWSAGALAMMEQWLDENVGPAGEFLGSGESQANYAPVSAAKMIAYGIAATRAGFRNFVDDPRLRVLISCLAKQLTPPDVRFPADGVPVAGTPASGRGPKGQRHGLPGMMARATAKTDPAFSAVMQWAWNRTGRSTAYLRDRLSGLESVYMDPALPETVPDWHLDVFPHLGAIMRHGVGTEHEWYVNFLMEPQSLTAFDSESGGFPGIWARGVPVSVRFGGKGYGEREELLISRVLPARAVGTEQDRRLRMTGIAGDRKLVATSALPRQHYAVADIAMQSRPGREAHYDLMELPAWPAVEREGKLPIHWRRQILFVRDLEPTGANYLVLRDTVRGNQPTMWQFWTLSEKIATPADLRDVAAFLADKPGERMADARSLQGDRFTALGQWGVDVDYYIASPQNTPRHTLRCGTHYHIPMQHAEYQDMLHLQLPGDGAYYIVLFPRDRQAAPARFHTLGDGRILRIEGDFGADTVFMAEKAMEDSTAELSFAGTAASVLDRKDGLTLNLGAEGTVGVGSIVFRSDGPVSLYRVSANEFRLELPSNHPGTRVALRLPGRYAVAEPGPAGVEFALEDAEHRLTVPAGIERITLNKRP